MTAVALYARVSTEDQDTANQIMQLRSYAQARGWTVAGEWIDHGVSGAKARRPGLDAMLASGGYDAVMVVGLDRLARSLRNLLELVETLTARRVGIVSLRESIDTSTPAGRMVLHVFGALAEFERALISERTKAGLARARSQGRKGGRRQITDEREGQIADLLRGGRTVRQICAALRCGAGTVGRVRNDMAKGA